MSKLQKFVDRANEAHNFKFDYCEFVYTNAKTASTIICPKHGRFKQKPDHHTRVNAIGCPDCVREMLSKTGRKSCTKGRGLKPFFEVRRQVLEKFGESIQIIEEEYEGLSKKAGFQCSLHGYFEKIPHTLLQTKYGCSECASIKRGIIKTNTLEQTIEKCHQVHNNKYSYDENQEYVNQKSRLIITCFKHGNFEKSAQKHLAGQGCFRCKIEELVDEGILIGGYGLKLFDENPKLAKEKGHLYFASVGPCYKIGITRQTPELRLKSVRSVSKEDVELLWSVEGSLREVFELEQKVLTKFGEYRIYKDYSTELLKIKITKEQIFEC